LVAAQHAGHATEDHHAVANEWGCAGPSGSTSPFCISPAANLARGAGWRMAQDALDKSAAPHGFGVFAGLSIQEEYQ
jgi:hypothetical protein